ncbi:MAG: AMP-binding protein, partial [Sphingorhabdus sp.]
MTDDLPAFPLDHLPLRGAPDSPALRFKDRVYSYQLLNHRIGRLAAILAAHDFTKCDRVATWLPKTELACLMPLAAVRAGLVHVPVNPLLKPAQVRHIMADSGAKVLITAKGRAEQYLSHYPFASSEVEMPKDHALPLGVSTALDTNGNACFAFLDDATLLTEIDQPGDVLPPLPADTDTDTLAAILYTSGSTGRPKGVMLSHANLTLGAVSVASYLKLKGDEVTLAVLPLSFD